MKALKDAGGFLKLTEGKIDKKAARLLLLLGKHEAARVMEKLKPDEVEDLARQIASINRVDALEAKNLLEEFKDRVGSIEARRVSGGIEAARLILTSAFGGEKAKEIIARAVPESQPKPFSFLYDLPFNQVAGLLRKENPTTLSLVMTFLDPKQASRLLESLPNDQRSAIVLRMARTQKVSVNVVSAVEENLKEKLKVIGRDESEDLDGRSALAAILRHMDIEDEKRLLECLRAEEPDLAEQVKEKLYTMDSILHLRERDLQDLLLEMKERDIALLLKGQCSDIKNCINNALTSRRRLLVSDESDLLGPVPKSDADAASKSFIDRLRAAEEQGLIIIHRDEEDLIE